MRSRAKSFDLTFGAPISPLNAPASHVARDIDGNSYDLSGGHGGRLDIPRLLSQALMMAQSKNEYAESRKRTNAHMAAWAQRFARWCNGREAYALSAGLLADFRNHLSQTATASTAQSCYAVVVKLTRLLMQNGIVQSFAIPSNFSRSAVEASLSGTGASFASALNGSSAGDGIDLFNEAALASWLKAAWSELDVLDERMEKARAWRAEVDEAWRPPSWFLGLREIAPMSRNDALSVCKSICVAHLAGRSPDQLPSPPLEKDRKWGGVVSAWELIFRWCFPEA